MKVQSVKSPPIKLDTVLGNQQSEDGIFEPEVGKSKTHKLTEQSWHLNRH